MVRLGSISLTAFKRIDPKSPKQTDGLTAFFALSGYVCVKAAR